jgi:hypothetical protein
MAYQVGLACYATFADAGAAACSSFVPISSITATDYKYVDCGGSDPVSGALYLAVRTTNISTGTITFNTIVQPIDFQPCMWSDFVAAIEICFGAALGVWAIWHGGKKLLSFLGWSRGENA